MKKVMHALLFLLLLFSLSACDFDSKPTQPNDDNDIIDNGEDDVIESDFLDIFYLNDQHGMMLDHQNGMGMARIANLLVNRKEQYPEQTIILAGGDMLQGSALSNYFYGASFIDVMNETYFDALVVGNHEFDWGLETITRYFLEDDPDYLANFPLLGANIFEKGTTNIPDGIDPYTVIERDDFRIGIIGSIGYGLESSIAADAVEGYEFANPNPIVEDYAYLLRTEYDCDFVLLLTHDSGGVNSGASMLEDDYNIDVIFNAHSHQTWTRFENDTAVIQSGGYGSHVGHVRFHFDEEGNVTEITMENLHPGNEPLLTEKHPDTLALIEGYMLEAEHLFNTVLIATESGIDRGQLTDWSARLMKKATQADIAFQNYGGVRQPLPMFYDITPAALYDVFPFDNAVKTVYLTGSVIKAYINSSSTNYATDITFFEDDTLYKVATNDYIFDQPYNPFLDGVDIDELGIMLRDLVQEELYQQGLIYNYFHTTNPLLVTAWIDAWDPPSLQP